MGGGRRGKRGKSREEGGGEGDGKVGEEWKEEGRRVRRREGGYKMLLAVLASAAGG